MGLSIEQKKMLLEVEKQRAIVSANLFNKVITEEDIFDLVNVSSDYGITKKNHNITSKELILKKIYNYPFLLCDQKLCINTKKLLPLFLSCRYNMEMRELQYAYELGQFTDEEYVKEKNMLNFIYYRTSEEGKEIKRLGHVNKVKNNTYKIK